MLALVGPVWLQLNTLQMISGRIECELAVVAAVCVFSIFLFPPVQGPYSAVNGPVTALQAVRAVARWRCAILAAALTLFFRSQMNSLRELSNTAPSGPEDQRLGFSELGAVLRC